MADQDYGAIDKEGGSKGSSGASWMKIVGISTVVAVVTCIVSVAVTLAIATSMDSQAAEFTCMNGGTANIMTETECQCADQYIGDQCEIEVDTCTYVECLNGGTCQVTNDNYTCNCADSNTGDHCEDYVNIALERPAFQSSTQTDLVASRAVDGDPTPQMASGSCSHTEMDNPTWWMVDLGQCYKIHRVEISNRATNSGRTKRFVIGVGDERSDPYEPRSSAQCLYHHSPLDGGLNPPMDCIAQVQGRYLTMYLLHSNQNYLQLCEVYVYGSPCEENLALGQPTFQSSTDMHYESEKAVDGNYDARMMADHCSKTGNDATPWWAVDLGDCKTVTTVQLTNCEGNEGDRLADFAIGVTNEFDASTFDPTTTNTCYEQMPAIESKTTRAFPCDGVVQGRYVTVYLKQQNHLHLCEVVVYGQNCPA